MSDSTIEERLAALEEKVEHLLSTDNSRRAVPDNAWKKTIGIFSGDPLFNEIVEEGRRIRHADRPEDDDQ